MKNSKQQNLPFHYEVEVSGTGRVYKGTSRESAESIADFYYKRGESIEIWVDGELWVELKGANNVN